MIQRYYYSIFSFIFIMLMAVTTAHAEVSQQQKKAIEAAEVAAIKAGTRGPAKIELLDKATLQLPKDFMFVPKKEAADLLKATGDIRDDNFFGVILPRKSDWIITVDYIDSGYVTDSDAKNWSADDLLKSLKEGTAAANVERKKQGFATLEVEDWIKKPTYNPESHKLIWALRGVDSDAYKFVNYNTYALGRSGYFELDLLTSNDSVEKDKEEANKILSSITFNNGQRYEDFVKGKDNIAAYGLAALVTGIAAKKLGLIAMAGVFFLKIWKVIALTVAVLFSRIKKLFSRKAN